MVSFIQLNHLVPCLALTTFLNLHQKELIIWSNSSPKVDGNNTHEMLT